MVSLVSVWPPLDGTVTLPETPDFNMKHNPNEQMYVFSRDDALEEITTVTFLEFARACHRVAHALRPGRAGEDGHVVAVVALADTLVYHAIVLGLTRAGFVPFPISPRNSPAAIIQLLKNTDCHDLVMTQATLGDLLEGIRVESSSGGDKWPLNVVEMPSLGFVFPKLGCEVVTDPFDPYPNPTQRPSLDSTALYLHSSGSSGWPKAIRQTHRAMVGWAFPEIIRIGKFSPHITLGAMALPAFHTAAVTTQVILPLFGLATASLFPPTVITSTCLPVVPTPDNVLEHMRRTRANALVTVPAILPFWSQSKETMDYLKSLIFVVYGGGPLANKIGNLYATAGVNLKATYGATEFGVPTAIPLDNNPKEDWEWVAFNETVNIRWHDLGDGMYELQLLSCGRHQPAVENMTDPRGYSTSDVFIKHPTKPNLWKVIGRRDDVIAHSSGEKTVPGPIEDIFLSSPLVQGALMFGAKHDRAGILIELRNEHQIDVKDRAQLANLRGKLWPLAEEANRNAPAFSRIFREMMIFTAPEKPLPRTPKGTLMRKAALEVYHGEIEALYQSIESLSGGDETISPPTNWEESTVREWLLSQASDLHDGKFISPSQDLFEQGFDSLTSTFFRLRVIRALQYSEVSREAVPSITPDTIYRYPTINSLSKFIVGIIFGLRRTAVDGDGTCAIEAMIEKYSAGFDRELFPRNNIKPCKDGRVVLITGSTGNLGSQILAGLLTSKRVSKVYAFGRPGHQSVQQRHYMRFRDKNLDTSLLHVAKLRFVETDLSQDRLGLPHELYDELQHSVDVIIHNAWRLDFNLTLPSFESNVQETRNLIDFARSGPNASHLRFLFTSSIASAQSWDHRRGAYPEEVLRDSKYAVGTGYGEGKYVSERILERSGLQACSIRIGQLCGGLPNGAWSTTDWFPILVKSSIALGAFPEAAGVVSWLPIHTAAEMILDLVFLEEPPPFALNLVHPRPIPWKYMVGQVRGVVAQAFKKDTGELPLVSFSQWVKRLEGKARDSDLETYESIPALKLLSFFQKLARADEFIGQREKNMTLEMGGSPKLDTQKAQEASATLRTALALKYSNIRQWISFWRELNFI